jgi:hypothetical protein
VLHLRTNLAGTLSSDLEGNEEKRRAYWQQYDDVVTSKLEGWQHEIEYRLVLKTLAIDKNDPSLRIHTYDFADLISITFGIHTETLDKLNIIKIIKSKSLLSSRNDFKIYQAYHCKKLANIQRHELNVL